MIWDRLENIIRIEGVLRAQTGMRIGAGAQSAEPTATDLPVMQLPDGTPFIPGSSLRGALRSHIERIVRTLEPIESRPYSGKGACNPVVRAEWCVLTEEIQRWRKEVRDGENPDLELARRIWEGSCRVCRLFGSPWLASRLKISDLIPLGEVVTQIRDGVAINRDKETVENKFDFEVVAPGAGFKLEIIAENLSDVEKGLLMLAVREMESGNVQIGGFKGRGLGWVTLEGRSVRLLELRDRSALRRYLLEGKIDQVEENRTKEWLKTLLEDMEVGDA
jgi:CRISPR-associated RAMP protein (TIGR02581 family)